MTTTVRLLRTAGGTLLLIAAMAMIGLTIDAWIAGLTSLDNGSDLLHGTARGTMAFAVTGIVMAAILTWCSIRVLGTRPLRTS